MRSVFFEKILKVRMIPQRVEVWISLEVMKVIIPEEDCLGERADRLL
jgi:ribosomal protein S12 methylthiotransferase accessory factor YcaO